MSESISLSGIRPPHVRRVDIHIRLMKKKSRRERGRHQRQPDHGAEL
ncbi:hypothetical protein [Streptomyces sp. NPDC048612]